MPGVPTGTETAEPAGQRPDRLDRVGTPRVDGVGGAHALGPLELPVVEVDGDDRGGAGQAGAGDGGVADPTAAEHGDAVARAHLAGFKAPNVAVRSNVRVAGRWLRAIVYSCIAGVAAILGLAADPRIRTGGPVRRARPA